MIVYGVQKYIYDDAHWQIDVPLIGGKLFRDKEQAEALRQECEDRDGNADTEFDIVDYTVI